MFMWFSGSLLLGFFYKVNKHELNQYHYGAVIDACAKVGWWKKALKLLREMSQNTLALDKITHAAAVSACEKAGEWKKALQLLGSMAQRKITTPLRELPGGPP